MLRWASPLATAALERLAGLACTCLSLLLCATVSACLLRRAACGRVTVSAVCRLPTSCAASGPCRTATKKAAGSSKNGRDSNPKYLGVKAFGG
jgi:hypothetical protein